MLTSYQASPIAYWADDVAGATQGDGPFCSKCADELAGGEEESGEHDELFIHYYRTPKGFQPASRYGVEEAYPHGVECERCGEAIVEPDPDLCVEHDGYRVEADVNLCDTAQLDGYDAEDNVCYFLGEHDPNPPVPRWVPCSECRAGDGEPHREGCRYA
jgi:hypothetical protein